MPSTYFDYSYHRGLHRRRPFLSSSWPRLLFPTRLRSVEVVPHNHHPTETETHPAPVLSIVNSALTTPPSYSPPLEYSHQQKNHQPKSHRPNIIRGWEDLLFALRRNQCTELRIGWSDCDWFHGPRAGRCLAHALSHNTSVRVISIGYRAPYRPALFRVLRALAYQCPAATWVTHFQLVLNDGGGNGVPRARSNASSSNGGTGGGIPQNILEPLLKKMTNLVAIDLRSVHVLPTPYVMVPAKNRRQQRRRRRRNKRHLFQQRNHRTTDSLDEDLETAPTPSSSAAVSGCSVVAILIQLHQHAVLKSIKLIDCHVTDDTAILLADFLHIRGGIAEISLRGNRPIWNASSTSSSSSSATTLGPKGLRCLVQAPIMERLDLALCQWTCADAQAIGQALEQRPWPLQELVLTGNYRLETTGLLAVVRPACRKLVSLNISYCDITDDKVCLLLQTLQQELCRAGPAALLRQVTMQQGHLIAQPESVSRAVAEILKHNTSLRVLKLGQALVHTRSNPTSTHIKSTLGVHDLWSVLQSLQGNYEMEDLQLDDSLLFTALHRQQQQSWLHPSLPTSDGTGHAETLNTTAPTTLSAAVVRHDLDFWLRLNRAGRRILRSSPPAPLPVPKNQQQQQLPLQDFNKNFLNAPTRNMKQEQQQQLSHSTKSSKQCQDRENYPAIQLQTRHGDDNAHKPWVASSAAAEAVAVEGTNQEEWFRVLEMAVGDLDVLYWIVRQSAGRFERRTTCAS